MTRPALTSLLALALAVPAQATTQKKFQRPHRYPPPVLPAAKLPQPVLPLPLAQAVAKVGACDPTMLGQAVSKGQPLSFPAGADKWETDLGAGTPCVDAVWRVLALPSMREKWNAAADVQAQAQLLSGVAKPLDTVEHDVSLLETAAGKVYDAALAGNIIKANDHSDVNASALKSYVFKKNAIVPNDAPTQFDGSDPDKASALLRQRGEALVQLAVRPPLSKDAKAGTPPPSARPGPLVLAYFQALEQVRKDALAAASTFGLTTPQVTPLIAPGTKNLADNYRDAMKALAAANAWDDAALHDSVLDQLQDRGVRDRVALNDANVEAIFQEARNVTGVSGGALTLLDKQKKDRIDALNAKLRANVADAIGYGDAKKAFDGDVAHNADYAQTAEGQYRAGELSAAKSAADSATIAPNGKGGYQLMLNGKPVAGKDNIPDLKTAETLLAKGDLASAVADDIMKGHPLLAKTKAALAAAQGGATSLGSLADPNGISQSAAGCDKNGESLAEYQKRLRDQQMEGAADDSAKRQGPLQAYRDALKKADDDYASNLAGKMNPQVAERIRDRDKKAAHDRYVAATASMGSMDDDIAARTANLSRIDQAAEANFVSKIKDAAPDLKVKMPGDLKKYVGAAQARVLLVAGGSDDGNGTLFDQFIAEEWTWGQGDLAKNAEACKGTYRQGDYGSLEKCAGKSLNDWLARRKAGQAAAAPNVDAQVRAGDNQR